MMNLYKLTATYTNSNETTTCYCDTKAEAEAIRKELKQDADVKKIIITKNH